LLEAILAERARKAARKAAGLPDTESSSSSSSDDDENCGGNSSSAAALQRAERRSKAAAQRTDAARAALTAARTSSSSSSIKTDYGVAAYWNERYLQTSGLFDWYVDEEHLWPLLDEFGQRTFHAVKQAADASAATPALPAAAAPTSSSSSSSLQQQQSRVQTAASSSSSMPASASSSPSFRSSLHLLDVGCGNSGLGAALWSRGWTRQTHIDVSEVVIARMKALYRDVAGQCGAWIAMDATQMRFEDASFDMVLEKGTLDALDCTPEEQKVCHAIVRECSRVLRPGGVLLVVTHGDPRRRLPLLQQKESGWASVETRALGYSEAALYTRHLRAQLQGKPIAQASAELKARCTAAARAARAGIEQELQRAQSCIARIEAEFAAAASSSAKLSEPSELDAALLAEEAAAFSPTTSSVCFVYACTKR
jgi:ubiquinone/menaquinone biosynthesis C-methylase UbiE